jgi:5-methylthioadenosine/S-adenosylhomocysteine deaminase
MVIARDSKTSLGGRVTRYIKGALLWRHGGFREGFAVGINGDRFGRIVAADSVPPDAQIEDWGNVALFPGTVNAHGHAFQNLFKGFADDRTFESWRDDVLYPFSEKLDGDAIYAGALFAFAEALLAGVTTTVDFFYLHDGGNKNAERVIEAARALGIRLVFARAFYDEDAPTKAPTRYREPAHHAAGRLFDLVRRFDHDELISIQPAPHSLHAASPETIGLAIDVSRELMVPCHLHLAEAQYEVEMIKERYGTTPVRLLHKEGLLDPRLVTIHTVWVDDEELDMLAETGVGVVHCPGANAFLGDGIARVPQMLERKIRLALGPDGGCANNRQSVFDEMRTASLVAKATRTDGSALGAPEVVRLATEGGADLLGLQTGAILPDHYADLVALDLDDISLHPLETIERNVVHSMQPTAIARVMVGGEVVVDRGQLTKLPLDEVRARVAETTKGWTRP